MNAARDEIVLWHPEPDVFEMGIGLWRAEPNALRDGIRLCGPDAGRSALGSARESRMDEKPPLARAAFFDSDDVYVTVGHERAVGRRLEINGELMGYDEAADDLRGLLRGQVRIGVVDVLGNDEVAPQPDRILLQCELIDAGVDAVVRLVIRRNTVILKDEGAEAAVGTDKEALDEEIAPVH